MAAGFAYWIALGSEASITGIGTIPTLFDALFVGREGDRALDMGAQVPDELSCLFSLLCVHN